MASPHHFTAVGHFYVLNAENCTDPDKLVPITGTIRFSPMLANGDLIRALSAEPTPAGIALSPVTGVIDEDGRVRLKKSPRHNSCCSCCTDVPEGVCLVGDSALLELETPLFYEVSFHNIKFGARPGSIASFVFQAPCDDGAVVDLVTVMRVPGQLAAGLVEGPPGPPGKDGADGQDGADGVVDTSLLEPIDAFDDDTEVLVVEPVSRSANRAVKVSPWGVLKARLETWVKDYLLDKPKLGSPEITTIRVPDPGYNGADIAAGIDPPRRNPGYFSVLDAREWLNPEGSPFVAGGDGRKIAIAFRHDLTDDCDTQFVLRTRKGGTMLWSTNGIDTVAGTSHIVLAAHRGNAYVSSAGNVSIASHALTGNQIVTAGNVLSLTNKTLVSPTITGAPTVNGAVLASQVAVPASVTATGSPGQWAADTSFVYVCVAANQWRRAALATW